MMYGYPQMFQQPVQPQKPEPVCKCQECKCEAVREEMEKKMADALSQLKKDIFEQQKQAWLEYGKQMGFTQ